MVRLIPILWIAFLIIIVLDIWKQPVSQDTKFLWTGVVFFFPGIGVLAWVLYGRNRI